MSANVAVFVILHGRDVASQSLAGKIICEIPSSDYRPLKVAFYDWSSSGNAPQMKCDSGSRLLKSKIEHCGETFVFRGQPLGEDWLSDIRKAGYEVVRVI